MRHRIAPDYPRQFASDFDCVTLAPVSGKHQIWLDFHKPLDLPPDRCSKLFYVENREAFVHIVQVQKNPLTWMLTLSYWRRRSSLRVNHSLRA